jgi:hypothetical protein
MRQRIGNHSVVVNACTFSFYLFMQPRERILSPQLEPFVGTDRIFTNFETSAGVLSGSAKAWLACGM